MNHFSIYGPLTVEGMGGKKISLTRNIYVLLKDVLIGWQRYSRGCQLSSALLSVTSQATGPAGSLDVCPRSSRFPASSRQITSPRAKRGDSNERAKNEFLKTMYFQVITNWESRILCPDRRGKRAQQQHPVLSTLPGNFEGGLCIKI